MLEQPLGGGAESRLHLMLQHDDLAVSSTLLLAARALTDFQTLPAPWTR